MTVTPAIPTLAEASQLDWRDGFTFLEDPRRGATGLDQYLDWVADWYTWAAQDRVQPTTDVAMRYLLEEPPRDAAVEVLWGDARIGNMVFSSDVDVAAVLDWEMAALGPGEVDLGWWLFMDRLYSEGFGVPRLEGLPDQESTVSYYEERRGREVSSLDYYLVLAGLRMAIVLTRTADLQVEYGILPATTTFGTHNPATRILAELLDLPVPDLSPDFGAAADAARAGTKE